jgi:8-oxo-dGTP pyrophosphatase MutT (NUDIX family)
VPDSRAILNFRHTGDWGPGAVLARRATNTRPLVRTVEERIDEAWSRAMARPGVRLFDGPMCRLESTSASPQCLRLNLSSTTYKTFLGTNLSHPELADRYGTAVLANPVGVSPALETADGFLLLGRRNASVAYYPGRVHPFAGALEPKDAGDVFAAVRRELREELSLAEADVIDIRCAGLVEDRTLRQPELIFLARCRLTRETVEAKLDPVEHRGTWSVPAARDAIQAALSEPELTPVAVASLVLWGRARFGTEWFEAFAQET